MKRDLFRLALVAVSYAVAARLSLNLALVHGQVTPIWPPTGIALVAFLFFGLRVWPAVYLAAFAVNLPIGPAPLGAAVIALGNTLAPLTAAVLLRRVGFHRQLDRLRDALAIIILAALGAMLISATIGSSVLLVAGSISSDQFWATWAVWWTGDAMGVLLVAPFLLSVVALSSPPRLGIGQTAELVGLVVATGLVTFLLFQNHLRLEYLVLPLIMVSAWRFQLRGAAPAALVASGVAIISAINGTGPFDEMSLLQKMITLQAFNVSLALASFVLASFVEARQRQEEMALLYAAEHSANRSKTRFLHLAAHELRTPVSVIGGYISMLADGSLGAPPEKWQRPLRILGDKASELNHLVQDLLEASRLEANAAPQVATSFDLRDVAREAIERSRPRAELLAADIAFDASSSPVPVMADRIAVGRILDNLINNAMTYTIGAPRLLVSVAIDGEDANIRVRDNGVGVPEGEQERIFEQFQRTSDPAFTNVPGTGLGLFISRELARVNGGRLVVESSSAEEGSVFLLSLPLVQVAREPGMEVAPSGKRAESVTSGRH